MRSYTFSPNERKVALQSLDLLKGLPTLRLDPVTNSLRPAEGGSLVILINGIRATENDLRMIPTAKVQRVQLYDVPPIRYQDASCVINVVTSRLDDGYTGGFEYGQSPQVGFGDGNAYFTYTLGRHRLRSQRHLDLSVPALGDRSECPGAVYGSLRLHEQ